MNTGPFTRERVSVFVHKRCEHGKVRRTKTGTVVARSAHQLTRYEDGPRAGETVYAAIFLEFDLYYSRNSLPTSQSDSSMLLKANKCYRKCKK